MRSRCSNLLQTYHFEIGSYHWTHNCVKIVSLGVQVEILYVGYRLREEPSPCHQDCNVSMIQGNSGTIDHYVVGIDQNETPLVFSSL
jgi:hypothetical protein